MALPGVLYDGLTARARAVTVARGDAGLTVTGDFAGGAADELVPWAQLRRDGDRVLRDTARADWLLKLDADLPPELASRLVRHGTPTRRAVAWVAGSAGAGLAVALGLWFGGDWLLERGAPLVPDRVARSIGRGFVAEIGHGCTAPAGTAALARLQARLTPPGGFAESITITVVDAKVVNALALPGGQVMVFRQLIDEAASPDELAGVLAHEFAHVERRHPNKALIRQLGVSMLARSIGGEAGGVADLVLLLQGSRTAEAEADVVAIPMLRRAGISPAPLAAFFERQRAQRQAAAKAAARTVIDTIGTDAATHPANAGRAERFRAAALPGAGPALTAADWQALRSICTRTKR